jgi:hypothetical protein
MFHLITLPIRLALLPFQLAFGLLFGLLALPFIVLFGILALPFILLRVFVKVAVGLFILPFVAIVAGLALLAAFVALGFALFIPLLPVAFVVLCIWAIVHVATRPAVGF